MNGAAADVIAGRDSSRMGVESSISRQQGRVDVEDKPRTVFDEPGRQDAHEAGERNRADAAFFQGRAQDAVEIFLAEAFAFERPGLDAARGGPFEAQRVRLVRGHQRNLVAPGIFRERAHIGPATGYQDGNTLRITHGEWRTILRTNS